MGQHRLQTAVFEQKREKLKPEAHMSKDYRLAIGCIEVDQGGFVRGIDRGATLRSWCRRDKKGRVERVLKIDDRIRKQGMSVGTDGRISQLDGGRNGTT